MSKIRNFFIITFILINFSSKSLVGNNKDLIRSIAGNCNGCHGEDLNGNEYMPSLKKLSKSEFINLMNQYRLNKSDLVMNRLSKALTYEDILDLSEFYY